MNADIRNHRASLHIVAPNHVLIGADHLSLPSIMHCQMTFSLGEVRRYLDYPKESPKYL